MAWWDEEDQPGVQPNFDYASALAGFMGQLAGGGGQTTPDLSGGPTFQGFGTNPGLGGMYAGAAPGYTPPDLSSLGNQWLDQLLGTGGGVGGVGAGNMYLNPGTALTAPPSQGLGNYGGLQGLEQLAYNPPKLDFSSVFAPAAGAAQPVNYGQGSGPFAPPAASRLTFPSQQTAARQTSAGATGTGAGQQSAAQQRTAGYGGQATAGLGGQQARASSTAYPQTQGYTGGTSNPANVGTASQDRMPFSIPSGGVYGQQKWLPGSTGADIFLPRGSPITAKDGGRVLLAQGGNSSPSGAEPGQMIVQFDDGTVARFRHVQPQANGTFRAGQPLAVVNDSGMDMLSRQVASQIGAPDGYQHLDLSVNQAGQTYFSPQGGGGGQLSAPQWLQQQGYQGRVVSRTPGPQEGMSGGGMPGGFGGMPGGGGFNPFGGMQNPMQMLQGLFGGR